ncbi:MAG: FG-GAP repeat domain-containing protein [Planctomycetota bacterium]|jgi:hypothetical protein
MTGTYTFRASINSGGFLATDTFNVQAVDRYDPVQGLGLDADVPVAVIGDVTGDGADDLVLATNSSSAPPYDGKLLVYTYVSSSLVGPTIYDLPTVAQDGTAAIADVTGDGLNDVIIAGAGADLHVFPQTLAGVLDTPATYTSALGDVRCLEVGDFNDDGLIDVVSTPWDGGVDLFLQLAGGDLASPVTYGVTSMGYPEICTGDLNGDGLQDVAVASGQGISANVGVLYQTPAGTLGGLRYFDPGGGHNGNGESAGDADIGDVDGDGREDLVVVYGGNSPEAEFAILYQLPNGKLDAPVTQKCMDIPEAVRLVDVDGNGLKDIVIASGGWRASVHLQASARSFSSHSVMPSYLYSFWSGAFAIGDLNGDGRPDFAFGDHAPVGAEIYFSR